MYTEGKFACFFECTNTYCSTVAVMSGVATSGYETYVDPDGEEHMSEEVYFYPKSMTPGPRIIAMPSKVPKSIKDEIAKSFSLLWTDRNSAVNKLRIAVEEILVDHGIERESATGSFLPLATRLDQAEKMDMVHHDTMVALKDVGNAGSHEVALPLGDLLDAYDIFEDALQDIYGGRKTRLDRIRARLTKPKKPNAKPPKANGGGKETNSPGES
jgi:hypothetical protein